MFPLLWLLVAGGIGAGTALLVKRASETTVTMIPGQVWTMVAVVTPSKQWTDISKGMVASAIRQALAGIGVYVIDGFWSNTYQFTVAASVISTTQLKDATLLSLNSEWASQAKITQINQAPAEVPVMTPKFP